MFETPEGYDLTFWRRNGIWSVYPDDHISRPTGSANSFYAEVPVKENPRVAPTWAWSHDHNELGSNDFRSTRRNIWYAGVNNTADSGKVTPLQGIGDEYHALRSTLAKYTDGEKQAPIPPIIKARTIPAFSFNEYAPIFENLPKPVNSDTIAPMEMFDQGFGSIIYRTQLPPLNEPSVLDIDEVHDYARVYIDGQWIGDLYRRNFDRSITLPALPDGARLDILVEGMGRVNFGEAMKDYKGITDRVTLTIDRYDRKFTCDLRNWEIFNIHDRYDTYASMQFKTYLPAANREPGTYRATFNLKDDPADTFLDFSTWGKGLVYVNGHDIGRIWEIGPQQALYVPGCWLRRGENEVIVFDIFGPEAATSKGLDHPVVDQLKLSAPEIHTDTAAFKAFDTIAPAAEASLRQTNGWQTISFDAPATGRYLLIEAVEPGLSEPETASIAEIYLLGADGKRVPRESWKALWADSEDVTGVNRTADKLFDLQESTFWSTVKGTPYPHSVVIDLGHTLTASALQILPRMETAAPGLPSRIRISLR